MLKIVLRWLLTLLYRVKVNGLENYAAAGNRVLIVANHTSFLDPLLLGVFLPDDITFAINTHISERWWLKPFLRLSKVFPMDPTHPLSLKALIHHMQQDTKTVIFPEGRITTTGTLMKIYDAPAWSPTNPVPRYCRCESTAPNSAAFPSWATRSDNAGSRASTSTSCHPPESKPTAT
ncbi:1-acyl-sn-glycerol-3-phosphate acyltransferase [Methylomonas koyamae]|uniref:1-acyl-sn-glycerol-3-phosphate acyltransferase n=1 Tax=Methylomonas koyamae TaxID=702114 RepID=UPI000B25B08B|nr:1-acyl-sn-glycerol-3-phosphate acyltransferase [Methylomonas koyamae]